MRLIIPVAFVLLTTFACSKEDVIPFIPADTDTLSPSYFHRMGGHYTGSMSHIEFLTETSYQVLGSVPYNVDVAEVDFNILSFTHIFDLVSSNAVAEISRFDDGIVFRFQPASLASSIGIDTVFSDYYNGLYLVEDSTMQYFIYYTSTDSIVYHYLFEGIRN